ncbi:H-NS histone family protein [Denitratisoma sp. agr-D3]
MDISHLSIAQLKELQAKIPAEIAKRQTEDKQKVLDQIAALATSHGFSLEELVGKKSGKKSAAGGKKVAAKYRHPSQPELTWTGRGRKPVWVSELLATGKTLESLAI